MNYDNLNNLINLKLLTKKLDNLNKNKKYRNNIKKRLTKIINQKGGERISLYELDELVKKFKSIDKNKISSKMVILNKTIDELNKKTKNINTRSIVSNPVNLDLIINDSSTFITKLQDDDSLIKKIGRAHV